MGTPNKQIIIFVTNIVVYDQRVLKVYQALSDLGFKVKIVGTLKQQTSPSLELEVDWISTYFVKGVAFYLEYAIRQFLYILKIKEEATLWCCDPDTALGSVMAFEVNRKIQHLIYDSHEYFTEVPELQGKSLKKSMWTYVESWICKRSILHLTVNESIAQILKNKYNTKFEVLMNVPEKQDLIATSKREKIILYQGALNVGRCLEKAIEMMAYLPEWKLIIAGGGDIEANLKEQAKAVQNVSFVGKLKPSELAGLTKTARFGLNLLEGSSLNYYYSLANKFFDYANHGVVSINNDFPEYARFQEKYQHSVLVKSLDPVELANQIKYVDEESYTNLQDRGYIMIADFNWKNETQVLRKLLTQIELL